MYACYSSKLSSNTEDVLKRLAVSIETNDFMTLLASFCSPPIHIGLII